MGLKDTRSKVIECLRSGNIQHEARDQIDIKNLLSTGAVSVEDVIKMVNATKGTEFVTSPHHAWPSIDVYTFKPKIWNKTANKREAWYVKCYLLEPDTWFISVHLIGK